MSSNSLSSVLRSVAVVAVVLATLTHFTHAAAPAATKSVPDSYGELPLSFEPAPVGTGAKAGYVARGQGYSLLVDGQSAVLALRSGKACGEAKAGQDKTPTVCGGKVEAIRMTLAGSHAGAAEGRGEAELPGKVNTFVGNDPAQWQTNVPTYGRVRWNGVYPGVDLAYYGNQGQLEYDFVVAPGANSAVIRMQFSGDDGLRVALGGDGGLALKAGDGEVSFHKPSIYQRIGGKRKPVAGGFRLLADGAVGFSVGAYDHSKPLVIDPILAYSTYLGGPYAQVNAIAVDAAGNTYVTGSVAALAFPVTPGAFQTKNLALGDGAQNTFVSKLSADGSSLLYSTFLGGSDSQAGFGIAVDGSGDAYVTGYTTSPDFPVTCGAFLTTDPVQAGQVTGFVTELNPTGSSLVYSTFLGGTWNPNADYAALRGDVPQAIAVDGAGEAFVTGYTFSFAFPVTSGALQTTYAGTSDAPNAFVTKLNAGGTALAYSTYLGGSGSGESGDYGNSILVDKVGHAMVAGTTSSGNFPVTSGALQQTLLGQANAFVVELNIAGVTELYGTFLGGSTYDSAQAIALGGDGAVYVGGYTDSADFPTTSGALEGPGDFPGAHTPFVTKFTMGAAAPTWSTYMEGLDLDTPTMGMAVDASGSVYLAGSTTTQFTGHFGGFVVTPDALPLPAASGSSSSTYNSAAYIVKLDPSGATLNYATLLGGSASDMAISMALDKAGNVYVGGVAQSMDFPTTTQAFQPTGTFPSPAFVSKLSIGGEQNQTAYPASVFPIATSTGVWGGITNVQCMGDDGETYDVCFGFGMVAAAPGPPPTGDINFSGLDISGPFYSYPNAFGASFCYNMNYNPAPGPVYLDVSASYSGDANYLPSSGSASYEDDTCSASPSAGGATGKAGSHRRFRLGNLSKAEQGRDLNGLSAEAMQKTRRGYKFEVPKLPMKVAADAIRAKTGTPSCFAGIALSPVFAPGSGTYVTQANVQLTDITPGAKIYYATHGATPTTSSAVYTTPIPVTATTTIKAIAVAPGFQPSPVASALFTIQPQAAAPVFKPAAGAYPAGQTILLTTTTPGATIYYATHGVTPTISSTKYSGPIPISATQTIKAIAVAPGYGQSAVSSALYTVQPVAATPMFSPGAGMVAKGQKITITDATHGVTMYYALHGVTPTTASTKYVGPITLTGTTTIKVIAVGGSYAQSQVATATFTVK